MEIVTRVPTPVPPPPVYDIIGLTGEELNALRHMVNLGYLSHGIPAGPGPYDDIRTAIQQFVFRSDL